MSEKKLSLFSFTKMNKYYLIPFITPIASFICNLLASLIEKEIKKPNFFFSPIINCLSDIIAGLIYFIQLFKNKSNSKREKKLEKNKCKIVFLIIFMTLLTCSRYICYQLDKEEYLLLPFSLNLILLILFSKFLLKINIYSHQILSIIISVIGFIFLFFSNKKISFDKYYIYIIISLLDSTDFSILKYSATIYFISPFICSFLYGIFSLIIYIIAIIICELYKFKTFLFIQIFDDFHGKLFILYFSLIIISASILKTLFLLEVYYFSPILLFISESINPMLYSFYSFFVKLDNRQDFDIYIYIIIGFLFEINLNFALLFFLG